MPSLKSPILPRSPGLRVSVDKQPSVFSVGSNTIDVKKQ